MKQKQKLLEPKSWLTKDQNQRLIKAFEDQTIEHKLAIEDKRPPFEALELEYLKKKEELELVYKNLKDDEASLQFLTAILFGKRPEQILHVVRPTSHLDTKQKPPRVSWTIIAKEVLLEANRFMSLDDLFSTLQARNLQVQHLLKMKPLSYVRSNLYLTLYGAAVDNKTKTFAFYNKKFGMAIWMSEDGVAPLPPYMKEFMFANKDKTGTDEV